MPEGPPWGTAGEDVGDKWSFAGYDTPPFHNQGIHPAYNSLAWGKNRRRQTEADQGKCVLSTFPPTYC